MIASLIVSLCVAALLIMVLRSMRALWEDQYREDASYRRGVWLVMLVVLGLSGAVVGIYGWRAAAVHAPSQHPALEVDAICEQGVWRFKRRGSTTPSQRDLRLRGGRPVRLHLTASKQATEFFVPGLGLKQKLAAGGKAQLDLRPPSPRDISEAAVYRSVCLHYCRGASAVRPFVVVVEAPRGVLAY